MKWMKSFVTGKKIAAMAVEHLISLGHRNIGYVGGCRNEDRYTGYLDTLKQHNLDVIPEYVIETNQTEIEGFEAMEKLLKSEDCPTGIYCANDITAGGDAEISETVPKSLFYSLNHSE